MTCTTFPSTGLVPNVTTHVVGNVTYKWTGVVWEAITVPIKHGQLSEVNEVGAHDAGAISGAIRTFSTATEMITNTTGVNYVAGQYLRVQGDDNTSVDYIVVSSKSDVDLGGGLWAKKLPIDTANLNHESSSAFKYVDALSKKKLNLPDLIEKAKDLVTIHDMYVRAENNQLYVGYVMGDKTNIAYLFAVEYRFVPNPDGLLLLLGSATAPVTYDSERRLVDEFTIDSGSLNTTSYPSSYAPAASGTVLSGSFKGNSLNFRSFCDNRGGLWLIRLESTSRKFEKTISTWNSFSSGTNGFVQEVFKELPYDLYNYTMTFIGDDPNHIPSGGAGTSRGWIYHTPSVDTQQPLILSPSPIIDTNNRKWLLPSNSVLDFAFSARRAGTSDAYRWVPVHSGVNGVSENINYKLIIDGNTVDNISGTVTDIPFHSVKSVQIVQRFSAKNPADPSTSLWTHYITHNLTHDGELSITNRAEFNVDTDIGLGYMGMLAAVTSNHNRVVFNDGTEQTPLITDGSNVYTSYGWDSVCYGGVFDSGAGISHGCVATIDWADGANAFGYYQPEYTLRQHWRDTSDITKTYWTALSNAVTGSATGPVVAGTVLKGKTRYFCIGGVRNPNYSLKPI